MAKVTIVPSLFKQIKKKFKAESHKILDLIKTLEDNPDKGKPIGIIGGILIKELKYKSFRFYFIIEGNTLRVMDKSLLTELLIKFVRMSDKNYQKQTINEIRNILIKLGPEGFSP